MSRPGTHRVLVIAALLALPATPSRAGLAAPEREAPSGRIEFVGTPDWRALTGRAEQGVLVVDLDALDDTEAAASLAGHWRQRLGARAEVQCWLRTATPSALQRRQLLSQAATLLAAQGCRRVLVPG